MASRGKSMALKLATGEVDGVAWALGVRMRLAATRYAEGRVTFDEAMSFAGVSRSEVLAYLTAWLAGSDGVVREME
jgi:hypothetical protein